MRVLSFLMFVPILLLGACGQNTLAPVTHYGIRDGGGSAGVHSVQAGDTLWTISNRYDIVMRDIAFANGLAPPFRLREGQRLVLPPPREYRVQNGDTLHLVSRLYGVSPSEIARTNDLRAPYTIRAGQVLRLPSVRQEVIDTALQSSAVRGGGTSAGGVTQDVVSEPLDAPQKIAQGGPVKPDVKPVVKPDVKPAAASKPVAKPSKKPAKKRSVNTPRRASSKFLRPARGDIISGYGPKKNGLHNDGINIRAPRGAPVKAADNGVVVYAGNGLKSSGNLVLVRHENRWMTAYAHLDSIGIKSGDIVKRGQQIGKVGSTGAVREPQLHFEIRRGTEALNPKPYLE